eukprot:Skav201880  [mRNA]  locus=scaffold550:187977:193148:- [translate_table: standard]
MPLLCQCDLGDRRTNVKVVMTCQQWEALGEDDGPVVLLGAKVTEQGAVLDMTGYSAAVFRHRLTISNGDLEELVLSEMFAGGYGGWSHAIAALTKNSKPIQCMWAIEKDPLCCSTYQRNHPKDVVARGPVQAWSDIKASEEDMHQPSVLFHSSVEDIWWMTYAARIATEGILFSAPCPPWSAADASAGLTRQDGRLLILTILVLGKLRPRTIGLENVGTLKSHRHFPVIAATFQWCKFKVVWSPVLDLADFVPQHRERMLLVAVNMMDDDITTVRPVSWPEVKKPTLGSYRAIMMLDQKWSTQATLNDDELKLYLDPANLPKTVGSGHTKRTRRDMIKYRLKQEGDVAACVLTSYGMPQAVHESLVKRGGLYSSLLLLGNVVRKHATPELVILFGTPSKVWLPDQEHIATAMMGNAIAPPHALITLLNMTVAVRPLWYGDCIQEEFVHIVSQRITAENISITDFADGHWFQADADFQSANESTQPMTEINELIIRSPLQTIVMSVESGILIKDMLTMIQGNAMPPLLELLLTNAKSFRMPVTEQSKMPSQDLQLIANAPSCFMPQEDAIKRCDWPFVLVLVPTHAVVVKRGPHMKPADLELLMKSCITGRAYDGLCHDMLGMPCNVTFEVPNVVLFLPDPGLTTVAASDRFRFHPCFGMFVTLLPAAVERELVAFLEMSGIGALVKALGWQFVESIRETVASHATHVKLQLQATPGQLTLQPKHLESELRTILFINALNGAKVYGPGSIKIGVKLFDTWVWHGWVEIRRELKFITQAWELASQFLGEHIPIRLLNKGRLLNPDMPIEMYAGDHNDGEEMKIHTVLQLHGRGPGGIKLTPAKRDVRDAPPDVSDHPDTVPNPVYHDRPERPPVADGVEKTVDRFMERLLQLPVQVKHLDHSVLYGLTLIDEDVQMTMTGTIPQVLRAMHAFQQTGVEQLVHEMGWQFVMRIPEFLPTARVQMVLLPIPGAPTRYLSTVKGFLVTAITYLLMPSPPRVYVDGVHVKVKLWDTWVVDAAFPPLMPVGKFNEPWFLASSFVNESTRMRMIAGGKQLSDEFTLADYAKPNHLGQPTLSIHLVLQLRGGGPGDGAPKPKIDGLIKTKNELVRVFMDSGCDIKPTIPVVEKLIKNGGLPTLNAILRKPDLADKLAALETLAKALAIELPDMNKAAVRRQRINQKRVATQAHKQVDIVAQDYKVKAGHYLNQDDTPCTILSSIQHACSGVYLCDPAEAQPWLEQPTTVTRDELALLVLGGCTHAKEKSCAIQSIPAFNSLGEPVVLSVCVHNLGAKDVKTHAIQGATIQVQKTEICAMTVFKDEIDDSKWNSLVHQPAKQMLDMIAAGGVTPQIVGAPWGRSWWGPNGKTTPQNATSLQMHCRVESSKKDAILKQSGLCGVYISMKNEDGSINTNYAVIWLDQNLVQMKVTISTLSTALGLIRVTKKQGSKTSRGIRVAAANYEEAWKHLKPSTTIPKHVQILHMARLEPTPVGASQDALREWLDSMKLAAKPIRPIGHKAWLVGFQDKPSEQWYTWNGNMMLLSFYKDKENVPTKPIVAGSTKSKIPIKDQTDAMDLDIGDPWMHFREKNGLGTNATMNRQPGGNAGPAASAAVRVAQGPIEDRFKQQDAQIEEMKKSIDTMQQSMSKHVQDGHEFHKQLDRKVVTFQQEVHSQLQALTSSFGQSLDQAMKRQDRQLSDSFDELKALMKKQTTPKKKAKKANGEQSDDNL